MTRFVALLRAVNVGGTGKLAMADLSALCTAAGLRDVRTYIASGNVLFRSDGSAAAARSALEAALAAHAGHPMAALIRDAAEMAAIVAANPFASTPGNRVMTIFLDQPAGPALLDGVTGQSPDEALCLGRRELYVRYGGGIAGSRLRIPAAASGTARNMNTVAKLAELARD